MAKAAHRTCGLLTLRLARSDCRDFTGKTVVQRRKRLEEIITPVPGIQVGDYIEKHGTDLFQLAKEKGLEGIIAKRKKSTYQPGRRTSDWLKIKSRSQQQFVICGFTESKGSRKRFGALLLGAYRNGKLRYFGHSITGFIERVIGRCNSAIAVIFHGQADG
jgi:bifunctional non-homologous end joining protein LigD